MARSTITHVGITRTTWDDHMHVMAKIDKFRHRHRRRPSAPGGWSLRFEGAPMRRQAYLAGIVLEAFFQWNASSMQSSAYWRRTRRVSYPVRLRRCRALTESCSSSERQRSITSMLKRHSDPTRKPGNCFARSNRYTVVGCTRRYSDSSRTVRTLGGVGAEPDFFNRLSSTNTL